tara:strand:+ start:1084 stop:1587 length:504 start_codon:yes stop_codon:yes gene_type:complete
MVILSTATSAQTFQFIPRKFVISGSLVIRDEETNLTQTKEVGIGKLGDFGDISVALVLEEGKFYELELFSLGSNWNKVTELWNDITINWNEALTPIGATWATAQEEWNLANSKWESVREEVKQIIYKDRIFCTDQTISQRASEYYDPIKGLYDASTSGDNTYKVYNG